MSILEKYQMLSNRLTSWHCFCRNIFWKAKIWQIFGLLFSLMLLGSHLSKEQWNCKYIWASLSGNGAFDMLMAHSEKKTRNHFFTKGLDHNFCLKNDGPCLVIGSHGDHQVCRFVEGNIIWINYTFTFETSCKYKVRVVAFKRYGCHMPNTSLGQDNDQDNG